MTATPLAERLIARSTQDEVSGCRLWEGRTDQFGYGLMNAWEGSRQRTYRVHRVAFMEWVGPIPDGLTIDHLCFTPLCINPDHLRLLTRVENARNQRRRYKTTCVHGHQLDEETTGWQTNRRNRSGPLHRYCLTCKRSQGRKARAAL